MKKIVLALSAICFAVQLSAQGTSGASAFFRQASETLRQQVMQQAGWAMQQTPVTVTNDRAARSAGGPHDFYSEGDYWWPNPASPDSPYIQKDGLTNPDNFTAHRLSMIRMSRITGALASAWLLTNDNKYVRQAMLHYKAWFADTATMMNPNMLYAQAIKGRFTGRGIGIIDGIQLMDAVMALQVMQSSTAIDKPVLQKTKAWFTQFLQWLTTHQYGKDEMNAANNHGTCWVMQVAVFAKFTGDTALTRFCSDRFKTVLLPSQMAADGSFPLELKRTKAYGYSLFNLDAMSTICQTLSTPRNDLWAFQTADGRSMKKAIAWMFTYIEHKDQWPKPPDVMYWNDWPVAQPALLFGAAAYHDQQWFDAWKALNHDPKVEEIIRNLPVRNPLLWMSR